MPIHTAGGQRWGASFLGFESGFPRSTFDLFETVFSRKNWLNHTSSLLFTVNGTSALINTRLHLLIRDVCKHNCVNRLFADRYGEPDKAKRVTPGGPPAEDRSSRASRQRRKPLERRVGAGSASSLKHTRQPPFHHQPSVKVPVCRERAKTHRRVENLPLVQSFGLFISQIGVQAVTQQFYSRERDSAPRWQRRFMRHCATNEHFRAVYHLFSKVQDRIRSRFWQKQVLTKQQPCDNKSSRPSTGREMMNIKQINKFNMYMVRVASLFSLALLIKLCVFFILLVFVFPHPAGPVSRYAGWSCYVSCLPVLVIKHHRILTWK